MIETLAPASQAAPAHDHFWCRQSPETVQYGVLHYEYTCRFCAVAWCA